MDFEIGAAMIIEDESRSWASSSAVNWAKQRTRKGVMVAILEREREE